MDQEHKQLDEVELVDAVKDCRDCQWFWGATPPYGPFPSHDWSETYPKEIHDGPTPTAEDVKSVLWAKVDLTGQNQAEPAVLKGCRKAPIMTIGINPNMTAYFAGPTASQWSYPWFSKSATYAYYYRYATIYQESFSQQTINGTAIDGTQIYAPFKGEVEITRNSSHRWMQLTFFSEGNEGDADAIIERAWMPDERLVVVIDDRREKGSKAPRIPVEEHELVALQISPQIQKDVELYANKTGYYERFLPVLHDFNEYLKTDFPNCALSMGEDVSMHDLVGCASPGWSAGYDIPRERIADNCVNKNQYLLDQVKQSRPKLILVVSDSSLRMLHEGVKAAGGDIELEYQGEDIFSLLEETCTRVHNLRLPVAGGDPVVSRIIITPHFSYEDNFRNQSRFTQNGWALFASQYPEVVTLLTQEKRINSREGSAYVSVYLEADDELEAQITHSAWRVLMNFHFQPYELMLQGLLHQHDIDPFITDKEAVHLGRDPANCFFCDNKQWTFPDGCDYK